MSDWGAVLEELSRWGAPVAAGEFLVVPTYAVYPSNSLVQAFIVGGKNHFVVSDGGGATDVLLGAGGWGVNGKKILSDFVKGTPLQVNGSGWLYAPGVVLKDIPSMVSAVTETSRDAAVTLLKHFKPKPAEDFRKDLAVSLDRRFKDAIQKRGHLPGASNKLHTFDYVIRANDNTILALDAVVNDVSSINAAVVAHMDVRATKRPNVRQFIIYDEDEAWSSADLALLNVGAPAVAFSHFYAALDRALLATHEAR